MALEHGGFEINFATVGAAWPGPAVYGYDDGRVQGGGPDPLVALSKKVLPYHVGQRDAPGHQAPVVRAQVRDARRRHEEVAPDEADLVLDVALLMSAVGVAKREVEPVVRRERGEQPRRPEPVRHLPADAGHVVEHDARRHAADELEGVLEALADALGVLPPPEHLRKPDVGERERDDKVEQAGPHAVQVEVRLRLAGAHTSVRNDEVGGEYSLRALAT